MKMKRKRRRRKRIIDVTGTPLTPSWQGERCLGNGEHPRYECCCDECGYFSYCFPQYLIRLQRRIAQKKAAEAEKANEQIKE